MLTAITELSWSFSGKSISCRLVEVKQSLLKARKQPFQLGKSLFAKRLQALTKAECGTELTPRQVLYHYAIYTILTIFYRGG